MTAFLLAAAATLWPLAVKDVHGHVIDTARLRGHVTVVNLVRRDSQDIANEVAQGLGASFGTNPDYLNVAIVDTSDLPFFLKPFAASAVESAEEESVEEALKRQKDQGNAKATPEGVRRRLIMVHDPDGETSRMLGAPAERGYYVGVLNKDGAFVLFGPIETVRKSLEPAIKEALR